MHELDAERRRHATGTPWEAKVGYSRSIRVGPFVHVTGTMAADESGAILHPGDAGRQAAAAFAKGIDALAALDASPADVVRTRMYVTNIDDQRAVGAAHRAIFGDIRPCATMVEVSGLAAPEALVEIELEAIVTASRA